MRYGIIPPKGQAPYVTGTFDNLESVYRFQAWWKDPDYRFVIVNAVCPCGETLDDFWDADPHTGEPLERPMHDRCRGDVYAMLNADDWL